MQQKDADALVDGVAIDTFQVKKDGSVVKSNAEASFWKGYVMAILLSMTTMIYGMNVARSIIQEKTSRIFEVMLAIAQPRRHAGGQTDWRGRCGPDADRDLAGCRRGDSVLAVCGGNDDRRICGAFTWTEAILFPVYFILGYLLYSSLFAGLAATCETEQELQMYMPLAAAPTWLSFALIILIINDSNSVWSVAASLFPPTAPIIMFLRMASEIPPWWQFAVSIGLLMLSIWGVLWFSDAALSRGHPDVWKAGHVAGADAVAALQLESRKPARPADHRAAPDSRLGQRVVLAIVPRIVWALLWHCWRAPGALK